MFRSPLGVPFACLLVPLLALPGCISPQLRKDTESQAGSLSDLYDRGLINLARFVYDIHSMPYFRWRPEGLTL